MRTAALHLMNSQQGVVAIRSYAVSTLRQRRPLNNTIKKFKKYYSSLNTETKYNLCFLRHGQSTWNKENRFIGWTDTPLTADGVLEARVAGQLLSNSGLKFDEVHTSLLRRSIRTVNCVLMELEQEYIPVHKSWRLNERSYGDLVGKHKKEAVKQYGATQIKQWRRGFDIPPPPMTKEHPHWPGHDPRYRSMIDLIPQSESLKDTVDRSSVYWDEVVVPALKEGKSVLVVGHENNLRSLLMKLEDISEDDIINLSLPRAIPLAYNIHLETMKPITTTKARETATGYLRGEWVGGEASVKKILDRDDKQVYDTTITENLEEGPKWDSWKKWSEYVIGEAPPEAKVKAATTFATTRRASMEEEKSAAA